MPAIDGLSKLGLGAISVPNKSANLLSGSKIHIGGNPLSFSFSGFGSGFYLPAI